MDISSRVGLTAAAFVVGRSYQPNLLTRSTMNQAVITGVSAASAYGVITSSHSSLNSVAKRIGGLEGTPLAVELGVDGAAAVAGLAAVKALEWREFESGQRAAGRLTARIVATAGVAGVINRVVTARRGESFARTAAIAGVTGLASWIATKPWETRPGAKLEDGTLFEDEAREIAPVQAAAIGVGITGAMYGVAKAESVLSRNGARLSALVLGGRPNEHRTLGRALSTTTLLGVGWLGLSFATAKLSDAGTTMEPGHSTPPTAPEITGCPESGQDWSKQTREGRRWLSMTLEPQSINAVMGITDAKQPIRVHAALDAAPNDTARAELLLAEIDRTRALERKHFALFSPTGSGYVNYVANEAFEYYSHGDCASASIQYSVLPSSFSLTKVESGTNQFKMVVHGVIERLLEMPAEKRPKFYVFGESLGSQVSEEMFRGTGMLGLKGTGIDAALWIGTPASTVWYHELIANRSIQTTPEVGPGLAYLPRSIYDWEHLPKSERERVKYLFLINGDDPIPKFDSKLIWRCPNWLGPDETRPIGSPHGTTWMPVTTFFATFFDMANALFPTPGVFVEGGHDYRKVIPTALRETWGFDVPEEIQIRVERALRQRELGWEIKRRWSAATTKPDAKAAAAKADVLVKVAKWTGGTVNEDSIAEILEDCLNPMPAPPAVTSSGSRASSA